MSSKPDSSTGQDVGMGVWLVDCEGGVFVCSAELLEEKDHSSEVGHAFSKAACQAFMRDQVDRHGSRYNDSITNRHNSRYY